MQNVCNQKSSLHYKIQYLLFPIIHMGNDIVTLNYPDMSTVEVRGQHLLLEHTCADLRCLICSKYILQLPNIWRFVSWHIYSVRFICDDDRDGGQDVIY